MKVAYKVDLSRLSAELSKKRGSLQQLVAARDDWLTDRLTDWQTDWLTDWQTDWLTDGPTDRCGGTTVNVAIALAGSLYQEPSQMSRSSSTKLVVLAHSNTKMLGVVVQCGDHELKHGQILPAKVLYIPWNEKQGIKITFVHVPFYSHLVPRLRMSASILAFSLYAFEAWSDNFAFTFTFTFTLNIHHGQ